MKTLLVVRHAKSSWKDESLDDHDRPLNNRGERDAPRVGEAVARLRLVPALICTSTALRARTTAERAAAAMGYDKPLALDRSLYHATPNQLLAFVRSLSDAHSRVMLVGHNPGLEDFVAGMTGMHVPLPTAAFVVLALELSSWWQATPANGVTILATWQPKADDSR